MATQDDPPTKIGELPLTVFELPKWLVEPAVRSCRLGRIVNAADRRHVPLFGKIDIPNSSSLLWKGAFKGRAAHG